MLTKALRPSPSITPGLPRSLLVLLVFLWSSFWVFPWNLVAEASVVSKENQVRVAYVRNFLNYVGLPEKTDSIVLCVFSSSEVIDAFRVLDGMKSGESSIKLKPISSSRQVEGCDVVFLTGQDSSKSSSLLKAVGSRPVLTIGESGGFTAKGGIIRLFRQDSKIRFEINYKAAQRKSISISSRLLKLAKIYEE